MDEFNNYTIEDFQTKETAIAQTIDALGAQLEKNSDDLYKMGQEYYQAWVELRKTKIEKVVFKYSRRNTYTLAQLRGVHDWSDIKYESE